jgi:hypothetical protein
MWTADSTPPRWVQPKHDLIQPKKTPLKAAFFAQQL